jgi:hypothetical protein
MPIIVKLLLRNIVNKYIKKETSAEIKKYAYNQPKAWILVNIPGKVILKKLPKVEENKEED